MKETKIAFYISTKIIEKDIDLSHPEQGNPGIGATEFLFILIASQMNQKYSREFDIYLLTDTSIKLPNNLRNILVKNEIEAVTISKQMDIDLLVIRSIPNSELFNHIDLLKQKTITWSHNRIRGDLAKLISNTTYVVKNICVGVHQALEISDHDAFLKSQVIYNPIVTQAQERSASEPIVTFIGHLDKSRGFHRLAKIWKDVIREVPNAKLNVIGGANLYNRNIKLGTLGVAKKEYEESFLKYIILKDGSIMPSINFLGIVGQEKKEIFKSTTVGVINPVGYETLGLSGIEMEAYGIPLVTLNKYGQSEIVQHGITGFLFNNDNQFKEYLITLLLDRDLNNKIGHNARKYTSKKFGIDTILSLWRKEINNILNNTPSNTINFESVNITSVERLKLCIGHLRKKKYGKWIPSIIDIEMILIKFVRSVKSIGRWRSG